MGPESTLEPPNTKSESQPFNVFPVSMNDMEQCSMDSKTIQYLLNNMDPSFVMDSNNEYLNGIKLVRKFLSTL